MSARTDGEVKEDVEAELRYNPNVDETHIAVEVMWGAVRLSGYVRNPCGSRIRTLPNSARRRAGLTCVPG
jgi:osmotically-inducible protein OsmY